MSFWDFSFTLKHKHENKLNKLGLSCAKLRCSYRVFQIKCQKVKGFFSYVWTFDIQSSLFPFFYAIIVLATCTFKIHFQKKTNFNIVISDLKTWEAEGEIRERIHPLPRIRKFGLSWSMESWTTSPWSGGVMASTSRNRPRKFPTSMPLRGWWPGFCQSKVRLTKCTRHPVISPTSHAVTATSRHAEAKLFIWPTVLAAVTP